MCKKIVEGGGHYMKRFNKLFLILLCLLSGQPWRCSSNLTGGGSESGNPVVIGKIYDTSGTPVSNTQVKLIPVNFNPIADQPLSDSLLDTTDISGNYTFQHVTAGMYNVQATHFIQGTKLLIKEVMVAKDNKTIVPLDTLKYPGALQCNFPNTVNKTGYVYIQGTELYSNLSDGIDIGNGRFAVTISNIPTGHAPRIQWVDIAEVSLLSDTTVVKSFGTSVIEVIDTTKPVWRFSCIAGVTVTTAQMFGGIDSVKLLIQNEIAQALKKFNNPGLLKGILDFRIDSIYLFTGDYNVEINKPLHGFDYRFIYFADNNDSLGSYTDETRTICQVDRGPGLFSQFSIDALAWALGMARGGLGLEWLVVKAKNNPVNNQDYAGITSFMNWPYGQNTLDWYTADVTNYYADSVYYGNNLVNRVFPKNITITVRDTLGTALPGIAVKLYGIGWKNFKVDTPAVITGTTDSNGELVISQNPFNPDSQPKAKFLNFLVASAIGNETAYTWLPITDVINTWLNDPGKSFQIQIQFKGKRNKEL